MAASLRALTSGGAQIHGAARQPCPPSSSGRLAPARAAQPQRRAAAAAPAPRRRRCAALRDEEAELERMAREAGQPDVWDSALVGNALVVALVAGVVAAALFIGRLGEPMVENTIRSFPTPAEYAAYEESR
ncbi:hypothetical protein HT031_006617 [Scenedesmus sp. PABB004]|nr:hypothetical protein HT031_006617 [Scenedesmus sp. PABB004]